MSHWIADDPNPEYSRFDRMDGLGEPLAEYEPTMPVWLQMILCGAILTIMFGTGVWILS